MDIHKLVYRAMRRLRLQRALNWNARLPNTNVAVPLLGEPLGLALFLYGESWKPEALRRIATCVPVSMVLDVGANEGQTVLDLTKADLGQLDVLAFEPNPACAYYLEKLIRLNGWRHVTLFPIALSDAARCVPLERASENDAGASLIPTLRPGLPIESRQVVPCFSLDQLIEAGAVQVKPSFLMKVDVEGAELDVLRGSQRALRSSRPFIMCEVLWAHCDERIEFMQGRNRDLMKLLLANDYAVFRFVLTPDQRALSGVEEVSEFPSGIYSAQNAHQCDYLFVPREHSPRVSEHFARG
ncbi:MAG TPA: FkbM family methyltransferase [Anaeromyxobacteraceae bacterium]|nr:FkbM family methyltransferase [Anaeromyxobacteraceae bacterium]